MENNKAHQWISDQIIREAEIEKCEDIDCEAMQRHCRKRLFQNKVEKNKSGEMEEYDQQNAEVKTWIVQFDKLHCNMFHNNDDEEELNDIDDGDQLGAIPLERSLSKQSSRPSFRYVLYWHFIL